MSLYPRAGRTLVHRSRAADYRLTKCWLNTSLSCLSLLKSYGEITGSVEKILGSENKHVQVLQSHVLRMKGHLDDMPKLHMDPRITVLPTEAASSHFDKELDFFINGMQNYIDYEKLVILECLRGLDQDCQHLDQMLEREGLLLHKDFQRCQAWYRQECVKLHRWKLMQEVLRLEEFLDEMSEPVYMMKSLNRTVTGQQASSKVEQYLQFVIEHRRWKVWPMSPKETRFTANLEELLRNAAKVMSTLTASRSYATYFPYVQPVIGLVPQQRKQA